MDADGDHDTVGDAASLAQDVQMAVGDRVEAAGKERDAGHAV